MTRDLFSRTAPSPLLRAAFASVALTAIVQAVWNTVERNGFWYGAAWLTWVQIVVLLVVGGAAAAQAATSTRWFWPGWIVIASVVFPLVGSSLLSVVATIVEIDHIPTSIVVRGFVLPLVFAASVAAALLVWHLEPRDGTTPLTPYAS
jgi:hypothetical protein